MAVKIKCTFCTKLFWARKDALYCSGKCRSKDRVETSRFKGPPIRSNIPGITWNRIISRWTVKVKIDNYWKYIGSFKEFSKAYLFQLEVNGQDAKTNRT